MNNTFKGVVMYSRRFDAEQPSQISAWFPPEVSGKITYPALDKLQKVYKGALSIIRGRKGEILIVAHNLAVFSREGMRHAALKLLKHLKKCLGVEATLQEVKTQKEVVRIVL